VRIDDGDGGMTTSAPRLLTVENVAPKNVQIAVVQPAGAPVEGTPIVLGGSFVDPGTGDTISYTWDVVSSNGQLVPSAMGSVPAMGLIPNLTFTPNDNGIYFARLTVSDGAASTTALLPIVVSNAAPSVSISSGNQANVETAFSLTGSFLDPGADGWTGTVEVVGGTTLVSLPVILKSDKSFASSYVFAEPGNYDVTITIRDGDSEATASIHVTVLDGGVVPMPGDMDVDGDVDFDDIDDFVMGLSDPLGYEALHGIPASFNGDIDGDGDFDFDDIDDFVAVLAGGPIALAGDMERDGAVGFEDIESFVLGLNNAAAYLQVHGALAALNGDIDGNGLFDFDDIDDFATLLSPALSPGLEDSSEGELAALWSDDQDWLAAARCRRPKSV
jgi:hypothetical protein